ncbi:MAG TPA: hypothetical protein VMI15_06265 [Burkholderiales bacterium]|nr:hypothetical protein [Burkholderiales bacterium]
METGPYWDEDAMLADAKLPKVLALGDSWFCYPFNNLLNPIWNHWAGGKTILCQGKVGAEARELAAGQWLKDFRFALRGYKSTLQAVLLSAGGNDFAGMDDMLRILKSECSGAATGEDCFNTQAVESLMFHQVSDAYRTLLAEVTKYCPTALVYAHNYDFAIPTGKGFLGFGHWLRDPMDAVHVPAAVQPLAVDYLINLFSDALAAVQKDYPDHVLLVDSRGTLAATDWANELHPTPSGFTKIVDTAWAPLLDDLPS